jgi:Cu(I)/Ag(I) efflux system membrane fusion protein
VLETGSQAVTYIDQGEGAYERRILRTGRRGDTDLEILSGLKENERVVTNGNLLIDGQAEMNRAFMPPPEPTAAATPPTGLNDAQKVSVEEFIRVADAMAAALAADDLTAFNAASDPAMSLTAAMVRQLRPQVADSMALDTLDATPQFHHCDNLKSARVAFHKFTVAATAALQPLRKAINAPAFQIYECGMVSQAIPGVPKKARWIQTNGRELQNPFFGSEMADCGEEIQP